MIEQRICRFSFRGLALITLPLFLAGCAGDEKSSAAAYTPAPASYFNVKLRPGDSLSEVAQRYDVKKEDLLALNEIPNQDRIIVGKDLRVPAYGRLRDERVARPVSVSRSELAPPAGMHAKNGAIPIPKPRPEEAEPAPTQQDSWLDYSWLRSFTGMGGAVDTANAPKLLWPVQGKIISNFGANAAGERNDGINILASRGTPVHAAAAGTVAYVGEELKNYGKLVLIRHEDGYVTAYAHSDAVTVSVGDKV